MLLRRYKSDHKYAERQEPTEIFWPLDLLPLDCTNSRILTWGYDSKVSHFFGGASNQSNITSHSQNLLAGLKRSRLDSVSDPGFFFEDYVKPLYSVGEVSFLLHIL